mgnify:CR=1 FL=1
MNTTLTDSLNLDQLDQSNIDLSIYRSFIKTRKSPIYQGKIKEVKGYLIKAYNPGLEVGTSCKIGSAKSSQTYYGEVVGFEGDCAYIMLFEDVYGIGPQHFVSAEKSINFVSVGNELLGRVVDARGNPLDGKPVPATEEFVPLYGNPVNPLHRRRITEPLDVGVKAINGLLTIGKGQRMCVIAGSGVGKSVLLGMMASNTEADVKIICMVGERGREVREFIEKEIGRQGMKKTIVVVATSEQSPLLRIRSAFLATSYAEYFREKGKDVLLLMDSSTRLAMARREIGLAVGEPPTSKGYPPSVYTLLPRLLERAGNSESKGSITGIYTALATENDMDDPIVDAVRSIVDGHIILDKKIAARNHFPAIDVLNSKSRVMTDIISDTHKQTSARLIDTFATYTDSEDMINVGAYVFGANPKIDYSIKKINEINDFLKQDVREKVTLHQTSAILEKITSDFPQQFQ